MKAQKGSGGITLFLPSVLNVKEARWAQGLVWTGALGSDSLTVQPVMSQVT